MIYSATILTNARIKADYVTRHSGMRTIVWEQQLKGIPVFEGLLIAHISRNGELVSLGSDFVPDPEAAAEAGHPNGRDIQLAPPVAVRDAVVVAANTAGENLRSEDFERLDVAPVGDEKRERLGANALSTPAVANLVWLPTNRVAMRLCWQVTVESKARGDFYQVLVDAQSSEALVRRCWTVGLEPASYRVFTNGSPTPWFYSTNQPPRRSRGLSAPGTNQPPAEPQVLIGEEDVRSTNASPHGWIDDDDTSTIGNNVDAHLDVDNRKPQYNGPLFVPRPSSAARTFDFTLDPLQPLNPTNQLDYPYGSTNQNAAVINAFYWCNWMHDRLYDLGFDEAAGNFQHDNLGRGGPYAVAGDALQVDIRCDGSDLFDKANFYQDGTPPRLRLGVDLSNNLDPTLDTDVLLHEYTHGLSTRLVGKGAALTGDQTAGLEEGWSDFYPLALLSQPDNDLDGNYPHAAYSAYAEQKYYFGNRRYPYSTNLQVNPLTLRDADPAQADLHPGVISNSLVNYSYPSVPLEESSWQYAIGELWCATLWEIRANLIAKYQFAVGNELALQLVTDGMKLCPLNPNLLQARDAILLAERLIANTNQNELWAAFAKRGLGWSAICPAHDEVFGMVEAFDLPPSNSVLWACQTGNAIYSSPAIGPDGTIYVGSSDHKLYAVGQDGAIRWTFEASSDFNGSPTVGPDGTIYIGCDNGWLYAVYPNGLWKWSYYVGFEVFSTPAIGADHTIYVGGYLYLYALNPDGTLKFTNYTGNTIYSSPAVAPDGTVYIGGMEGRLHAVDGQTGQPRSGSWPVSTGSAIAASPAIAADGTIYVGCENGRLYAYQTNGGSPKWEFDTGTDGIRSSAAIGADGTVYVGSGLSAFRLHALDPATGTNKWSQYMGSYVYSSPAVGDDGTIFVGSYNGKLYAMNPNGSVRFSPYLGSGMYSSPAIGLDGRVYIGAFDGRLYCLPANTYPGATAWPMFGHNKRHIGNSGFIILERGHFNQDGFRFDLQAPVPVHFVVEASTNLINWSEPLLNLPEEPVVSFRFTDFDAPSYPTRFYRVQTTNSAPLRCLNPIGYVTLDLPPGYSMISNPLNIPETGLDALMPGMPEGMCLSKWNQVTGTYDDPTTFYPGIGWYPETRLLAGESALVWNPTQSVQVVLIGEVLQGYLSVPLSGTSVVSSLVPQSGPITTTLGLAVGSGLAPGDRVSLFNPTTQNPETYCYDQEDG